MQTVALERSDAPRVARATVARYCQAARTGPQCADFAALATSEVVTNAVVHGVGAVGLGVSAGPVQVRVEVGDDSRNHPRLPLLDEDAESGRGMILVDAVSSAWGVFDTPTGKVVWFEVPAQP